MDILFLVMAIVAGAGILVTIAGALSDGPASRYDDGYDYTTSTWTE